MTTPEALARTHIDKLLGLAGWAVHDRAKAEGRTPHGVVAGDQIRTMLQALRGALPTVSFPGRQNVPRTLIFTKEDSHAEDIVRICRKVLDKGNDFCQKITYRTTGIRPEDLIAASRTRHQAQPNAENGSADPLRVHLHTLNTRQGIVSEVDFRRHRWSSHGHGSPRLPLHLPPIQRPECRRRAL
ncbi:MAG TPA: hypothetical protein PLS53_13520 [Thermoanaerobaculaceae bacterium]|nr:hypothetical protein [Thermoanaerobaculaceae bacterium]HPS79172.1 hypothetical protein [Thermoanaerobaculaceae bacterium]